MFLCTIGVAIVAHALPCAAAGPPWRAAVPAGRSQAYAVGVRDIEPVEMQSSCAPEAKPDVNRGAAFLLALAPLDARRAFERAREQDPDCALAGWGIALSWLPDDPRQLGARATREGREAIRRARSAPVAQTTARERRYVASVAILFDPPPEIPPSAARGVRPAPVPPELPLQRVRRYRDAMRNLATASPEDAVATILSARAALLLSTVPDDDHQREAAAIIEGRFGPAIDRIDAVAAAAAGAAVSTAAAPSAASAAPASGPVSTGRAPTAPARTTSGSAGTGATQAGGASADASRGPTSQFGAVRGAGTLPAPVRLGAALTLLLARDRLGAASLARPAADVAAQLATLPLARHLPARTYARLGDWPAAVASTEAAIKLAGSPASSELIHGPDDTDDAGLASAGIVASEPAGAGSAASGNAGVAAAGKAGLAGGNIDARSGLSVGPGAIGAGAIGAGVAWRTRDVAAEWLVEAYLQRGQVTRARALIDEVKRAEDAGNRRALEAAVARMEARFVLGRADWMRGADADAAAVGCAVAETGREAIPPGAASKEPTSAASRARAPAASPPTSTAASTPTMSAPPSVSVSATCAFVRAYSAARLAWPGAKPDRIADAARLSEPLGAGGTAASVPELLRVLVRAAMAAGQEEHPELELLATFATDLEERLERSGQLVLPLAPVQELLGDLFLQANRFEQARTRYRSALNAWPNRARAVLGLARASVRLDDRAAATAAYRQLLQLWADADPDLPERLEARQWLDRPATIAKGPKP